MHVVLYESFPAWDRFWRRVSLRWCSYQEWARSETTQHKDGTVTFWLAFSLLSMHTTRFLAFPCVEHCTVYIWRMKARKTTWLLACVCLVWNKDIGLFYYHLPPNRHLPSFRHSTKHTTFSLFYYTHPISRTIHTSTKLNGEKQCSSSLDREVGVRHTSCHSPRVCQSGVSNISQSGRHVKRIVSHPRVCRRMNNWWKFDVTWSMSCDWKCDTRIDEANRPLITAGRGRWK